MKKKIFRILQPFDNSIQTTPAQLFYKSNPQFSQQISRGHGQDQNQSRDADKITNVEDHQYQELFAQKFNPLSTLDVSQSVMPGLLMSEKSGESSRKLIITSKQTLIKSQIPPGIIISLVLIKQSGFTKFFSPQFKLYLTNGKQFLLSAKNNPLSRQVFKLSFQTKQYSTKSINYIGAISSNAEGSNFWLRCPISQQIEYQNKQNFEQLKSIIIYSSISKTKKMQVVLPDQNPEYSLLINKNNSEISVNQLEQQQLLILKQSNKILKKVQTKKDFQLIDEEQDYTYLKFSQIDKSSFSLQIQHPLTILQAFSIVLTRFEASLH